jgi:hypothetical protein
MGNLKAIIAGVLVIILGIFLLIYSFSILDVLNMPFGLRISALFCFVVGAVAIYKGFSSD